MDDGTRARAASYGQTVMLAGCALYAVLGWFIFDALRGPLGGELAGSLIVFVGVFAIQGAHTLGERAGWWLAMRSRR